MRICVNYQINNLLLICLITTLMIIDRDGEVLLLLTQRGMKPAKDYGFAWCNMG